MQTVSITDLLQQGSISKEEHDAIRNMILSTGTLAGGKADIKLDADFAALIHTEDYHVFLTSHGDYHIHTPQRGASGFSNRSAWPLSS